MRLENLVDETEVHRNSCSPLLAKFVQASFFYFVILHFRGNITSNRLNDHQTH